MSSMTPIENNSRRHFLKSAAGLTLAFYLPNVVKAATALAGTAAAQSTFEPNAFLRIGIDNTVTVISKHLEMGQGSYTGLATIVAEELDASWSQVVVEGAAADVTRYANLELGVQLTGGSTAIANSWDQLRSAGASARAMLVAAAAKQWQVPANEITVSDGVVAHVFSKRSASFGELAESAAQQPIPTSVKLKDPKDFKLIGKHASRKDSIDKTTGKARFTQDVHLPGMLTAVVAHPPRFGATVKSFDATRAKAIKGVVNVVAISSGVAVVAKDTWSAKKGRDALDIVWNDEKAFMLSSAQIFEQYHKLAETPGLVARKQGDADNVFIKPAQVLTAAYDFPYLAHAPMEPLNCVVQLSKDRCEIWNGEQMQTGDQYAVAALLGLKPEQVIINMLYAGGSFGRRACKDADYVIEAVNIAKAIGGSAPIKLVWLREDDTKGGYYRPAFHHALEAALDTDGKLIGWRHRLVGQSIVANSPLAGLIKNGVDQTSVEGAANLPYAIPNMLVDLHSPENIGVPVLWWRSVGSTHTAYSTETFIDEIAVAAGHDPVTYRLDLLKQHPRHTEVLKLAAEKSSWDKPLSLAANGDKRGRGVAVHESFKSYVAQVAEVTIASNGTIKVDRVVCAVDCGIVVNPDNVRAQIEGAIGFALSALLHGAITLKEGVVEQSNFHDYAPIRINEMPVVEVHIVNSSVKPTGIGEPGVPPLAPAVANAIAAAIGKRIRRLPINSQDLVS